MNAKQQAALDLARSGHSFFLTGAIGTGKTTLLCKIIKDLRAKGKKTAVTASTGLASKQISGCDATTLHHWAGLRDNRYTNEQLLKLIEDDISFKSCKENILTVDVLVVDEISMISRDVFDQLECICRTLRNSKHVFGGIQLILCGDFNQLKPVPSMYDPGHFCFTSPFWNAAISHTIVLKDVLRVQDPELLQCINELSLGVVSKVSTDLLHSLARPLPSDQQPIYLFARNYDVELKNYDFLYDMPGVERCYTSTDTGDKRRLNSFGLRAKKNLVLKQHAKVMLTVNISPILVNGTFGVVDELLDDHVLVTFKDVGQVKITPYTFTVFSREEGMDVATRKQLPLTLAYALTMHKAQGMSLNSVVVDCSFANKPGQLATAVGRATSRQGLRITNFNCNLVVKQDQEVKLFYERVEMHEGEPALLQSDFSCCRQIEFEDDIIIDYPINTTFVEAEDENEDYFEETESDENLGDVLQADMEAEANNLVYDAIRRDVQERFNLRETRTQEKLDACDKTISDRAFYTFMGECWGKFRDHYQALENKGRGKLESKDFVEFLKKNAKYEDSQEYSLLVANLSQFDNITKRQLADKLFRKGQEMFLELCEKGSRPETIADNEQSTDISDISRAGVRYLAGMCIAKLKYKLSTFVMANIHKRRDRARVMHARSKIEALKQHTPSQNEIMEVSNDVESLQTIVRKQNHRQGLTHVSDEVFSFYLQLDKEIGRNLSVKSLGELGSNVLVQAERNIWKSKELVRTWSALFPNEKKDLVMEMMEAAVLPYFHVRANQYRKDRIGELRDTKTLEIRKAVWNKRGGSEKDDTKGLPKFSFENIMKDQSIGKTESHNALKIQGKKLLSTFSKGNLQKLCKMYAISSSKKTKAILIDELNTAVKSSSEMKNPEIDDPLEGPAPKRRRKKEDEYLCPICSLVREDDKMWVGCDNDNCGQFICRICAELENDDDYFKALESHWTCPLC